MGDKQQRKHPRRAEVQPLWKLPNLPVASIALLQMDCRSENGVPGMGPMNLVRRAATSGSCSPKQMPGGQNSSEFANRKGSKWKKACLVLLQRSLRLLRLHWSPRGPLAEPTLVRAPQLPGPSSSPREVSRTTDLQPSL